MVNVLTIVQVTLAVLLIILVLLQRANTDAGGAFSSDGVTGVPLQKRGAELVLHRATIIVAIAFVASVSYDLIASFISR
jgi:protein translocase SecG subunit